MSRTTTNIVQVVSPTDLNLVTMTEELLENKTVTQATINIGPITLTPITDIESLKDLATSHNFSQSRKIRKIVFQTNESINCTFERGITQPSKAGNQQQLVLIPAVYEAEFYFSGQGINSESARNLVSAIHTHCNSADSVSGLGSEPMQSAFAGHLERLASLAASVTEQISKAQLEYDNKLQQHQRDLGKQAETAERLREDAHEKRLLKLAEEEKQLEEKRAELDLRRARDARRKLREQISTDLKQRLEKPVTAKGSTFYRAIVSLVAAMIIAVAVWSAGSAISSIDEIAAKEETLALSGPLVFAYARFFGSSALAAFLVFYLLSYLRKTEAEDTRFERELERFALDINRASWVAETVIEFSDDENGLAVPDAWIQGVTNGLFQSDRAVSETDDNALEALGELLKMGAKLKVGNGGAEVELDSRAAKKTAKSSS